ncbi:MAG: hypothetical protein OXC30_01615 [Alphaproteobacteria bacterium]|nr:hypothetical protein [Alphaproteobacteria bacterium]
MKNIMIIGVMLVLQAKSASDDDSIHHFSQSCEGVQVQAEDFEKQLRHLMQQNHEIRARIEGLRGFANFVVESNPDCAHLTHNMHLRLDDSLIINMGFISIEKQVEEYKSDRKKMSETLRDFRAKCDEFLSAEGRVVKPLRIVDESLHDGKKTAVLCPLDQDLDLSDLMSSWASFGETLKDAHRIVEAQISLIDSCKAAVATMAQEDHRFQPGSDLAKFFKKHALKTNLKGYRRYENSIKQEICRILELLPEHLEKERRFRSIENPLVVLREQCAELTLSENCANFQASLYNFWQLESALTTGIAMLADRAHFFKKDNVAEYDSVFPKLNREDAKWFEWWGRRLNRLATEFTDFEGSLQRRIAVYAQQYPIDDPLGSRIPDTQDLCSGSKCLPVNDDDSVLPPIQVDCDSNDLCSHLENFIETLKEIQVLDDDLWLQRQIVHRNFYGVICDATVECTLGATSIAREHWRVREYAPFINVTDRSDMIGGFLGSFSEFLKTRNVMVESVQRCQRCAKQFEDSERSANLCSFL